MIRSIPTYFEKTVENHSAYFQQLFRDHYEPLCARAFQMVHDRKASEDIVQDVFLALWERREEVDFDRPLLPLLFVAVKNRAIDLLRSKKWRGGESGLDELDVCIRTLVADHIEEEFQLSQLSEEIDCCISGLSEQCRRVFLLSRTTGLKNREIAERLNISVKTVEKHIGAQPQRISAAFPLKNRRCPAPKRCRALLFPPR